MGWFSVPTESLFRGPSLLFGISTSVPVHRRLRFLPRVLVSVLLYSGVSRDPLFPVRTGTDSKGQVRDLPWSRGFIHFVFDGLDVHLFVV